MCFNCGAVHNLSEVGEQWAVNGLQALITELKTDHSESKIAVSEAPRPDESNSARGQDTRRKRPRRSEQRTWSCCLLGSVLEERNQHQNLKSSQTHIFSTLLDFTPREHSVAITFYNFTRFKSHKSFRVSPAAAGAAMWRRQNFWIWLVGLDGSGDQNYILMFMNILVES